MKQYTTYEETGRTLANEKDTRTESEWKGFYDEYIDHSEYSDFSEWITDMIKSGNLIEEKEEQ